MTQTTLLTQTGVQGTTGANTLIGSSSPISLQFNPQNNVGFSGTISIDGSTATNPGPNDWFQLINLVFSGQSSNIDINAFLTSPVPYIRARVVSASLGAVAVYAAY